MFYFIEARNKAGFLAGQRTAIGLEAAKRLHDHLKKTTDFEVVIYSTIVVGGLIDKNERIDV
jgi:hypothetical protein